MRAEMMSLVVVCTTPGLHRGGVLHPPVKSYSMHAFTGAQLREIMDDPSLHVIVGNVLPRAELYEFLEARRHWEGAPPTAPLPGAAEAASEVDPALGARLVAGPATSGQDAVRSSLAMSEAKGADRDGLVQHLAMGNQAVLNEARDRIHDFEFEARTAGEIMRGDATAPHGPVVLPIEDTETGLRSAEIDRPETGLLSHDVTRPRAEVDLPIEDTATPGMITTENASIETEVRHVEQAAAAPAATRAASPPHRGRKAH